MLEEKKPRGPQQQAPADAGQPKTSGTHGSIGNSAASKINRISVCRDAVNPAQCLSLLSERCAPSSGLGGLASPLLGGLPGSSLLIGQQAASLRLAQLKAQLALTQINNALAVGRRATTFKANSNTPASYIPATPPSPTAAAINLLNLLKIANTMSHHLYNPFASENKSSTQGQYGVHSRQAEIDPRMGSSRLGPGSSFSSPGTSSAIPDNSGGMFSSPMSQSMNYRPEQSRAIFDEKTERSSDVHMSRVRDEMRLPGQPIHRSIDEGTRFTGSQRDEFRSSGTGMASYQFSSTSASQGHRNSDTECSRSSLDWLLQRKRSTADDSMHYSSSEPDRQSIPGLGDYDHPVPDKHAAHTESSQPKYTTEAATNILLSLGFEKEDLEHLISYPDDQITPANLPFILRQIRIQKAKRTAIEGHSRPYPEPHPTRSVSGMDSHSVGSSGVAGMRQGETSSAVLQPRKVIDYGHVGKYTGMAGDEIGQTRDSRLNSSGSGSMQLMDSYNTSRLSREPLQRSPTEVKSSALGSSRQQTGSVPSSSSSYSSILKSVAPPSYDQTKRLPATPNQTSQTILSSFSLPKKDTDMRVFTSEASKPLPSKEPEADRQSTSKTQPLSTLFQHVLPRRPGSVLTGSNDNSDTKVQSKAPSQESRVAEQMKKQQMKKQQMQKQPVQQKQPVDRQSKQQKQQAQKQSVSQAGQALWPSVFPVSKSVPSTAVIPAITDTSRNTQHSTFIPGDLRGISTVPAKPQPIPSPIGLKHTTAPTSTRPPPAKVAVSKTLPTLAMMHDYAAASPRIFPHTCSLCNKECTQMKDWISHQNSSLHLESCTRLRKQYPDWDGAIAVVPRATGKNAKPPAATSAQTFQHRHQKVRHGSRSRSRSSSRSLSCSSSSSPHRHHGSDGRTGRRSMGSRSPQSSRYTRRSRSHSPWYDRPTSFHCRSRSRSSERRPSPRRRDDTWSSPKRSYERQSSPKGSHETRLSPRYDKRRSSPRRVEEPPRRFDERRSPQRRYDERQRQPRRVDERQSPSKRLDKRRSPPRRIEERCSSPKRIDRKKSAPKRSHESQSFPERSSDQSKKSNSAERLARRILEKTDVQTLSAQSDLEAMAKTLAPVILAELNKIKSSSSSSSSTTKKKLPAKRSKAKPSLQKRETDKASPPTMVKLDGIHDALSYNDVVSAAKQFGKTWSVVLSRSKQQAVVVYEKEEDAKKLKSLRSLDVNGVAVTVVTEKVSDVQRKPPQKKPVTATTTSTATKKALLPTPSIPPLFPTPLLSGAMTAIPSLLSSSKPSPRPLHSAALKAVTIKPTSQEVAAKGSVKAPAAVTASKVLVSKAKNISSKQIAKTTEARKLPVKGAAKKAVAKKEMSSGSKSVAPKNQPDVGTSNVKKSKVVLKETAENRGTTKKTNVEAQQRVKLGKANDVQGAAPMQLGETGVETAEPTQVEDCANSKGKKPTTTDAVPENSAEKPSKGLLTTSAVETLPTETKMTPNDPVTAVKTQSDETSAMDASTPTEPAAAAACEQQPAVTTASSAAVLPLTIGETQQHQPMEVESCADGKEGKPTTTDVVLEDSADGPSESQTATSETLQTGADRVQEDSATPEKMQLDETSAMEASTPTEPAAAAACEQQPAVTTASSAAVPPLTIAETQQHLPMEVESCADGKEGKPTTTDVVLEDSADGPSESQTATSETLQTGADRVQEDSAEKMQSDETSAMDASTPTEPAAAASTSSETAVTPLTIGETIEEHLHLDMIPSFNQRVLSQPNFYQLRGQQVLITGLPTYDDGCYTEEDVANLLMPFGFKYKCDKLYVVPQMCVAFVQMPTEVDESNIKSPNDQKPLFLKGSKLSFHLLSCDFEMTPSGLYKSLMDLVKSPVVERGPRTVFIDNIAPGDAGVLNKTLKEMYSLSNYLPLLNKVFIEFETVGDAERFENWYDGVKKDFGHKVLRLKIPSSSSASPIPQTAEENQTDGDSAKDEAVTSEPGAAAASEQEPAESTTSTASVMATTSTTTAPDEYLSFDEMIEKYLNPNAIECIDPENNNDQKLLLITGLPAYYDGSYKEDNISKLLIPLGFQHRYDNIYIVPQSRLAFVKMPTVEAVNKIMDVKGKTGIAFKGSTIRFHVVSNMNAETPGNFYDSVMKLMKLPGVDDMNKIVVVSNISQSEFVTLREALKDVYSVRRYLPLLNKVFIQFDTVSEVDEFDAWFCGVKHAYGHEVHMEKKSQQQPAASTPSTPSTPSTSSTPSTATVTPLTIGEMVEKHLDPLKIKCFDDMDRKALTQDNKLLLITGLPEFSDGCYTEDNITKLLIPLGFKHQYDNIYIVPECRLAFVKMPSAKILRNLMEVKGKNGIFFKGSKIHFQVVSNFSAETPLDFYKSLMKLMKTPVIGDGRNIVIINNMSPGDTKDLRGALKNFGAIRNYLPLLNKVFIEFVSIHDPDRFAPWYNLHKKALKSSVYRMRIQSRTSTSQNPVDPAVTSQTDATDKPQTDVAVKTESDAAVKTESDAAVTSQTDAAVTSQTDAAVKTKTDEAATSQMDAPVTSRTDAAVTLQIDAAATSQTDAAVTSPADAAATSQTDAAATSQTDAAATSQTDAAATSQTDAAATSQTDAAATSQKDAAAISQKDAAVTSQKDAAVTPQTESAPAVISSTVWDMSEKLLDPKKIPCLKHMSLSSLKSLHRVPLLITGLPEFYDGCYTEADVAKLFIPFGYNYSPKSCPNIFVVPQSRWALVQMSRDTASTMHLATKKKQLVLKGCKLSVSLTVCGVKMLPLMIFQFLMNLMDVPLDEANGFKMVMVSNLPQVYVKDLRKALKKSGSVRSFLPLLNKVFIEFESLDDVGHFETWFRSFKTGSGPQVIRLKRVVSDKDSSNRTKPAAAAASTSATSGKMGEKHKPHDRIVSFNSENYTPTKADSVSSHITITRHFDEQNFNEDASPEPRSSSSSSRERTGRRSSGVSSAGKQILAVRKSSSSSKLSHKTSSSSGQKTNSRVKTSSSGRNTRSSSAGHEKENIKSASSLELSIETHLRKLREEAEAGGASLKVQKEWSEDDFDECTEEVDGEIYQILDSLDDQTDEPMESENQDGSVENQTSGSEEYETFYEEDFQVLDCIDDDGKAYSEEDSEMEMDCSFQVLDSVTEDLPASGLDNSDDKDGEMKEDHYQGKCGQSDKGDRMKKTQEEASKDVEQPEDHPLQDDQDKHDDETETFEILDSVGDQTATEEGDQKLETPSKQICEDINATEEQEEAFQIVDSVEDQPTATENKSDPDNKGRRSKRGVATSRKDGGPSRRSGRPTTASKTEEKEKTPKKQDRTTRAMDSSTKVSKNDEVVSEEMVYEVVDSVGDEPVEDSATTESSRRRSAGRSREDKNTSNLTESTYSVEDKTANDELTNATRSTRGRRARTSMKDAVNEKMKKEGMPTRRSRTPARESQERQKTPKKEEKPSPKESTATKTSVVREVSEDGAAFTILDSVEDKVEDDQPAAGPTEGRETPKKEDETTEKGNETLKKAEKDESEKVAEEGEATYEVLDSVEDKTIDGQHPAVLSESSGKEDISSKDDEQTQGEVMESASKTDVKNENSSAPKPRSDAETLEVENKQELCKKNDTPSTLENLDEVSDEEEDYPDDTAVEEKLGMKRTATKEKIIAKEQETRRTRAREDRRTKEREERERMERRTKEREEREDRKIREREERERMDWRTKEREERWREDRKSRRTRERDEREREDRRSRRTRERDEREQRSRSSSRGGGGGGGGSSGLTVKDKDEETVEVDPSELVTLDELEADEVMSDEGIREEDLLALVTLDEYIEEEEEEEGGQAEQSTLDAGLLLQESESVTFVTLDGADGSDVEKKPDGEQAEETSGSAKSKHDDDTVNVVVGEEEEKEKEEDKEEVTTRTRSQAKKRTRQTPAVRKPRGATAGPEAKKSRS